MEAQLASPWVDGLTFAEALARIAETHGDRDALVFPQLDYRCNYWEFQEEVHLIALGLTGLGVQRGDHVGIWCTNLPEWVIAQFAVAEIGAVLVNINPAYRTTELEYVLRQADIHTLLLTDQFKSSRYFDILAELVPEFKDIAREGDQYRMPEVAGLPRLRNVVSVKSHRRKGMWNWEVLREIGDCMPFDASGGKQTNCAPDDVVNIQYTSGTTGFPKGAMLTHRNLLMNAWYVGERMEFTAEDRLCIPVPFYHCFGCVLGTLVRILRGAAMVIPAESFDPLATLEAIAKERCTGLHGVPTMFIAQLNHPRFGEFNLRSLRTGVMAGSPCPIEVMRAVGDSMGATRMTIGYGLTEASPIITQTRTADSLEHRIGTVGTELPGVEVRIVGAGTMTDVKPGEPGELIARGHGVMKGYYHKPEETAAAIEPDGWLHSGDLAMRTADGYYRITGRIKDMIIRGGENIYPREIEEFLYAHPAVADVQIVGLPDEKMGEEVCAWVRLKAGQNCDEASLKAFCKERIAHFKVPRYVVFVEEYPTTVTGKIQKYKLREMGIERFGLKKAAAIETA